jgi:hypothetical protein
LFTQPVDDATVLPFGLASMADAVPSYVRHISAWYADLVGLFLVRPPRSTPSPTPFAGCQPARTCEQASSRTPP